MLAPHWVRWGLLTVVGAWPLLWLAQTFAQTWALGAAALVAFACLTNPVRATLVTKAEAAIRAKRGRFQWDRRLLKAVIWMRCDQSAIFRRLGLAVDLPYEVRTRDGQTVTKHRWVSPKLAGFAPAPYGGDLILRVVHRHGQTPSAMIGRQESLAAILHCEHLRAVQDGPVCVRLELRFSDPLAFTDSVNTASNMDAWFDE